MEGKPHDKKEKSGAEPVIVPLVLNMAEFDHKVWLVLIPFICYGC